jgi:hypothetical protein
MLRGIEDGEREDEVEKWEREEQQEEEQQQRIMRQLCRTNRMQLCNKTSCMGSGDTRRNIVARSTAALVIDANGLGTPTLPGAPYLDPTPAGGLQTLRSSTHWPAGVKL